MKKALSMVLALTLAFSLAACGKTETPNADDADVAATDSSAEASENILRPMETTLDMNNFTDATVPVAFDKDGLTIVDSAEAQVLTFDVYEDVRFDAVEVSQLAEGDSVMIDGAPVKVESIESTEGALLINGGLDNGGIELSPAGGGTYVQVSYDDYVIKQQVGTVTLPVSADCTITDSADIDNPDVAVAPADFAEYLAADSCGFRSSNTVITVVGGEVTAIVRNYVP